MTPALVTLILQLVPVALKWGTEVTNAIIQAIKGVAPPEVTEEQIRAVFLPFHQYAGLADFEKEAGVIVNPDGSVSPQPVVPKAITTTTTTKTTEHPAEG